MRQTAELPRAALALVLSVLSSPWPGVARAETAAAAPPAASPAAATNPVAEAAKRGVDDLRTFAAEARAALSAVVLDTATGATLAAFDERRPLNPASNAKVVTAAAVLDRLGPDHRFTTGVYGKIRDGTVSPLVLRGDGDPSLGTDELWELASALYEQGVRKVNGIRVDQSRFDDRFVPPAFEQQPDEWAPFRAPVSAVALAGNTVTLNVAVRPGASAATTWFHPPGFVDVRGSVDVRPGTAQDVRLTVTPAGDRLRADVSGFVGEGAPRLRFTKRVDDPRTFPGYVLAELLRRMGTTVAGPIERGGEDVHARLAYVESEPLGVLVRALGKESDNFYAEMLLKALAGAVKGAPARSADGAAAVTAWLGEIGALDAGTVIRNGSGLFDANRVSARTLAAVLAHAVKSPRLGPDYVSQLAVGGVDGTLRTRFAPLARSRAVRAKTGTLDQVVALSGYVLRPNGAAPLAFAFIVDGTARRADARQKIDAAVAGLARAAGVTR